MSQQEVSPPFPVEGIAFERSGYKTVGIMALWGVIFGLSLCVFTDAITARKDPDLQQLIYGLGGIVFIPIVILRQARSWWRGHRLIISSDRIQLTERRKGEGRVLLQIPFANIAAFKYEDNAKRVCINLFHLDDEDTYAPSEDFEGNRKTNNWHYCITVGYRDSPRAIADRIELAYSRWIRK